MLEMYDLLIGTFYLNINLCTKWNYRAAKYRNDNDRRLLYYEVKRHKWICISQWNYIDIIQLKIISSGNRFQSTQKDEVIFT